MKPFTSFLSKFFSPLQQSKEETGREPVSVKYQEEYSGVSFAISELCFLSPAVKGT
jgi:hypothetical protein